MSDRKHGDGKHGNPQHGGRSPELDDLLVDYATEGLNEERWLELSDQLSESEVLDDGFAFAAAALDVAHSDLEPMPQHLQLRVEDQAKGYFASQPPTPAAAADSEGSAPLPFERPPVTSKGGSSNRWSPWALAVAASLVAILGWAPRIAEQVAGPSVGSTSGPVGKGVIADPDVERDRLLGRGAGIVQVAWSPTDDPAGVEVSGDLVWSSELQEGYMLFEGLPINDPSEVQYQLWIFDRSQDERYPIDGGVFDVTGARSVVPIRATLRVDEAYLFAVTIERPGGVVVSSRERLPLLASL